MEKLSTGGVFLSGRRFWILILAGAAAGTINGLLGAGGGMVLVPILSASSIVKESQLFPASISIILPICIVSLIFAVSTAPIDWNPAFPYLLGSALGGFAAGMWGKKIPVKWLHRGLGIMILAGGIRYLC